MQIYFVQKQSSCTLPIREDEETLFCQSRVWASKSLQQQPAAVSYQIREFKCNVTAYASGHGDNPTGHVENQK